MRSIAVPLCLAVSILIQVHSALAAGENQSIASASEKAGKTQLKWLGHAAFQITTPRGHVLFIDPWLSNPMNPATKGGADPLAGISKADYILITHGHFDHVADAVALAKKTGAHLVTHFDLGTNLVRALGFPAAQAGMDTLFNIGGELTLAEGEVMVAMTPAIHSSGLDTSKDGKGPVIYGGAPGGFIVRIKNGPTIYHSGDTAYFAEMAEIGRVYHPDIALLNIGGHFGMEVAEAGHAAEDLKVKLVIPMHFKTFPILTQTAEPFFKLLDAKRIGHLEMRAGEGKWF